jgi:hypothetical protein
VALQRGAPVPDDGRTRIGRDALAVVELAD